MSDKIGKFYSNKSIALLMGKRYSEQEKQDVYLYQSNIGQNQYEYSLRFRSEIINPESSNIMRQWEYVQPNSLNVVVKNQRRKPERTALAHESNVPAGASSHPSAPFNEVEDKDCPACDDGFNAGNPVSFCCGATFHEPGYPDNIRCSTCQEPSHPEECYLCEGEQKVHPSVYDNYKAELKEDQEANEV